MFEEIPIRCLQSIRDQFGKGRLTVPVRSQKCNPVILVNPEVQVTQDRFALFIGDAGLLHANDRRGKGTFGKGEMERCNAFFHNRYRRCHFLQSLHARLRLFGFTRFGLKAFHKRFHVAACVFLFFALRHLLHQVFTPLALKSFKAA